MFHWLRALTNKRIGRTGERRAAAFLKKHGYRLLEKNWRSPAGEVDIIAVESGCLVFVEVKTRGGDRFGTPLEAVGPAKQRRIIEGARTYARLNNCLDVPIRFDVVSVYRRNRKYHVELTQNAFEGT